MTRILKTLIPLMLLSCAVSAEEQSAFKNSLNEAKKLRYEKKYPDAAKAYDAAFGAAKSETDRAIALSRKAHMYAIDMRDCDKAEEAATAALRHRKSHAVGHITALEVLAYCKIQDKKYDHALTIVKKAEKMEGVDWAQGSIQMLKGDAYRLSGEPQEALKVFSKLVEREGLNNQFRGVAYLNLGLTYQYGLRQPEEAKQAYKNAVKYNDSLKSEVAGHLEGI